MQSFYDPMNHRTSLLIAYNSSKSHNVCLPVSESPQKAYNFLISSVWNLTLYNQLSFHPRNHVTSLLIAYSTSISHTVCLSDSKRTYDFYTFLISSVRALTFCIQLTFDPKNHWTSLLILLSLCILNLIYLKVLLCYTFSAF